jgi:NADPH:quinone reductase-like Zn-dependent oxidoreductase
VLAAYATAQSATDPLAGLVVGERPEPTLPGEDWVLVRLKTAALNHHDLWSLRGIGLPADALPRILGCDGAGITPDGDEVVLHAVIADPGKGAGGDETLDPGMSMLSEQYDGTLAELIAVPRRNLVPKPPDLSWEEAACLPCAWLTAYRMLVTRGRVRPGDRVLIQGAGGGVATAAITLARAMGAVVWVTSRDEAKRTRATELGAHETFGSGERLPERADVVIETVGKATWSHSLKALRPGGTLVVSGATSGPDPSADLARMFARQLHVVGSTMGTREELQALVRFLDATGVRPLIDSVRPLSDVESAFRAIAGGDVVGKLVVTVS